MVLLKKTQSPQERPVKLREALWKEDCSLLLRVCWPFDGRLVSLSLLFSLSGAWVGPREARCKSCAPTEIHHRSPLRSSCGVSHLWDGVGGAGCQPTHVLAPLDEEIPGRRVSPELVGWLTSWHPAPLEPHLPCLLPVFPSYPGTPEPGRMGTQTHTHSLLSLSPLSLPLPLPFYPSL